MAIELHSVLVAIQIIILNLMNLQIKSVQVQHGNPEEKLLKSFTGICRKAFESGLRDEGHKSGFLR